MTVYKCMDTEPFRDITSDWAKCMECGWVGSCEHTTREGYGPLMFCPACSCGSFEEYDGSKTVEIPVDLLFAVRDKLVDAVIMLGNPNFPPDDEYVQFSAKCVGMVRHNLYEFLIEKGLMEAPEESDATDQTTEDASLESQQQIISKMYPEVK